MQIVCRLSLTANALLYVCVCKPFVQNDFSRNVWSSAEQSHKHKMQHFISATPFQQHTERRMHAGFESGTNAELFGPNDQRNEFIWVVVINFHPNLLPSCSRHIARIRISCTLSLRHYLFHSFLDSCMASFICRCCRCCFLIFSAPHWKWNRLKNNLISGPIEQREKNKRVERCSNKMGTKESNKCTPKTHCRMKAFNMQEYGWEQMRW